MAAHRGGCQVAIKPLSCSPNDVIKLVDDREPGRRGEEDCNPSVCPKCGASCPDFEPVFAERHNDIRIVRDENGVGSALGYRAEHFSKGPQSGDYSRLEIR